MKRLTIQTIIALEALKEIERKAKKAEEDRIQRAVALGLCPECSKTLISEPVENLDKPKTYLCGLIKIRQKKWDYRMVCPTDKSHYELKYDSIECDVWV